MLQLIATHENIFVVEAFCVKNSLIPFPPPSYTPKKNIFVQIHEFSR